MFINFFRQAGWINTLILPFILVMLWVFVLPRNELINSENAFPLFLLPAKFLVDHREVVIALSMVLILTQAYLLNFIINRHGVIKEYTHLPSLLYVVLMSSLPEQLSMNPMLFANLFILLFFNSMLHFYHAKQAAIKAFDAGIFLGIATLFYWPSVLLFIFLIVSLLTLRVFNWKEWIAGLAGLLLPLFFLSLYFYLNDSFNIESYERLAEPFYKVQFSAVYINTYIIVFVILTAIILGSVVLFVMDLNTYAKLKTRRYLQLVIWFLLFAAFAYFISEKKSMIGLSFLALPLSVLIANYFFTIKRQFIGELLFLLLLIAIIYNQVLHFEQQY